MATLQQSDDPDEFICSQSTTLNRASLKTESGTQYKLYLNYSRKFFDQPDGRCLLVLFFILLKQTSDKYLTKFWSRSNGSEWVRRRWVRRTQNKNGESLDLARYDPWDSKINGTFVNWFLSRETVFQNT